MSISNNQKGGFIAMSVKTVSFRLDQEEWAKMTYLMRRASITSASAFVRKCVFQKKIKVVKTSLATERMLYELNRTVTSIEMLCDKWMERSVMPDTTNQLRTLVGKIMEAIEKYDQLLIEEVSDQASNEMTKEGGGEDDLQN